MENVIEKAAILIEALPYIRKFQGETVVVKFGGSIMEDEEGVRNILKDIAFMQCVGMRPVIVHGGGKAISRSMKDHGLEAEFRQGLRVTDEESIRIVEHVLNHTVNPQLVEILESFNCLARGMHGDDLIRARQHTGTGENGETIDWGFVGEVDDVDTKPVEAFLKSGITPVLTPLGRGPDKKIYNINADVAAAAMARALTARKLVFLSDVPGVLREPENPDSLVSHVTVGDVDRLIEEGVIAGGMLPKLSGALRALEAGVRKTHIIDSSLPHSLLLELFTDKGVGTEIVKE